MIARHPDIVEHQVRVSDDSIIVDIVTATTNPDLARLERELAEALATAGTTTTPVAVRTVRAISRDPRTGKVIHRRRWPPLVARRPHGQAAKEIADGTGGQ